MNLPSFNGRINALIPQKVLAVLVAAAATFNKFTPSKRSHCLIGFLDIPDPPCYILSATAAQCLEISKKPTVLAGL